MTSRKVSKNKRILIIVVVVGLIVSSLGIFKLVMNKDDKVTTNDGQPVNLNPATDQERQEAEDRKQEITKQQEASQNPSPQAKIVITDTDATKVKAYISNIFEEGGTCTATASQGSSVIKKSSKGFQNVSYTQCEPIAWDAPLSKGSWTITLTYKSTTSEGSQSKTIEVQ